MPSKVEVKLNLKGLEDFKNSLSGNFVAKVGILGNSSQRQGGDVNNASIGAVHEFGSFSKNIPKRSFLRLPFFEKRSEFLKKVSQIVKKESLSNNPKLIWEKIAIYGVSLVQEAFDTRGFGKWKKLSDKTIAAKGSDGILIDTAQLRKSITYRVDKNK